MTAVSAVLLMGGAFVFLSNPQTPRHHSVTLIWHAPAPAAGSTIVRYNIYRSTIYGGPYVLLGSSEGLTYKDEFVNPGTTYYYLVKSVDQNGRESRQTDRVKAKIPAR